MTAPIRVEQRDHYGCTVACLAMVTGRTYEEVRAGFPAKDFAKDGQTFMDWESWLAVNGYAVRRLFKHYAPEGRDHAPWPPPPFAEVHVCTVATVNGGHAVVMLRDGTVLDPQPGMERPKRLTDPDYVSIHQVTAVYRVDQ